MYIVVRRVPLAPSIGVFHVGVFHLAMPVALLAATFGGGCASQPPAAAGPVVASAPAADSASPSPSRATPAAVPFGVPMACATKAGDLCTPPPEVIERLCARPHQEVALTLFARPSPFTRLYLKGKLDELAFDEEVLALRFHQQQRGGMIVGSGNGTYDVLRWDGTCSMGVEAEAITRLRPPRPRVAHVRWHRIGDRMQSALIASSDAVKRAHGTRGRECKGAMSGDVSAACEKADAALVDAIVACVRESDALPRPEGL
jgi:hypothetical protein